MAQVALVVLNNSNPQKNKIENLGCNVTPPLVKARSLRSLRCRVYWVCMVCMVCTACTVFGLYGGVQTSVILHTDVKVVVLRNAERDGSRWRPRGQWLFLRSALFRPLITHLRIYRSYPILLCLQW